MTATSIEWVRGPDGSPGMSWNALRAERVGHFQNGKQVSAHHCEHVNEACKFCYAERINKRLGGLPFKPGHRKNYKFVVDEEKLTAPLRRKTPTRIFIESMSDTFGEWWPDEYIDQLYAVMALTPRHTYVNLSKRPERRRCYLNDTAHSVIGAGDLPMRLAREIYQLGGRGPADNGRAPQYTASIVRKMLPLPNVIEGTSVSNQAEADEFIPILLNTKAALRCVSCEPLLGGIDLRRYIDRSYGVLADPPKQHLDWIIAGGESGPNARPMHPQWARDIRDQCEAAGVPFFFKQWGEHSAQVSHGRFVRVGKNAAGRLLDGREWNEFPA